MPEFGLIGYPIAHSKSPELFAKATGGRYAYRLIETPDFKEAWQTFIQGPFHAVNVTAPFKKMAAESADFRSGAVEATQAANILVKTENGIFAYNSDVDAVRELLGGIDGLDSVLIVGCGGAGRAAIYAAQSLGLKVSICNRTLSEGVHPISELPELAGKCGAVVYTLPCAVDGIECLKGCTVIEANYRDPVLAQIAANYIGGRRWLELQAQFGYEIMLDGVNK